jgi:hypothetical protein
LDLEDKILRGGIVVICAGPHVTQAAREELKLLAGMPGIAMLAIT